MAGLEVIEVQFDGKVFDSLEAAMDSFGREALSSLREAEKGLQRDALEYLRYVHRLLADKHGEPWAPRPSGQFLFKRSGQGLRDILESIQVRKTGEGLEAQIAARGYMATHETGGTISAKRSKYLTIPLPAALDSKGMPLRPSSRDWENTFVQRSKKGNLLIFQKRGAQIVPLYVLKSSVFIPARLGMGDTINDTLGYFEKKVFERISMALEA